MKGKEKKKIVKMYVFVKQEEEKTRGVGKEKEENKTHRTKRTMENYIQKNDLGKL